MSKDEVIKLLKLIKSTVYLGNRKFFDAIEFAINYLSQPEPQWIPCHDPSDLPKDKRIWITREYEVYGFRDVSNVIWDMTEWSDNVSGVVAYMPYIEPEPYEESGREK